MMASMAIMTKMLEMIPLPRSKLGYLTAIEAPTTKTPALKNCMRAILTTRVD